MKLNPWAACGLVSISGDAILDGDVVRATPSAHAEVAAGALYAAYVNGEPPAEGICTEPPIAYVGMTTGSATMTCLTPAQGEHGITGETGLAMTTIGPAFSRPSNEARTDGLRRDATGTNTGCETARLMLLTGCAPRAGVCTNGVVALGCAAGTAPTETPAAEMIEGAESPAGELTCAERPVAELAEESPAAELAAMVSPCANLGGTECPAAQFWGTASPATESGQAAHGTVELVESSAVELASAQTEFAGAQKEFAVTERSAADPGCPESPAAPPAGSAMPNEAATAADEDAAAARAVAAALVAVTAAAVEAVAEVVERIAAAPRCDDPRSAKPGPGRLAANAAATAAPAGSADTEATAAVGIGTDAGAGAATGAAGGGTVGRSGSFAALLSPSRSGERILGATESLSRAACCATASCLANSSWAMHSMAEILSSVACTCIA